MQVFPIENYMACLEDESRLRGEADGIVFPENTEELALALAEASKKELAVTLQGARTGLCGGAVPEGGLVVNLERMNAFLGFSEKGGRRFLRVQAGVTLGEIEKSVRAEGLFFPPNPTEKSATIGGVFATGGAGPSSLRYGPSAGYVEALAWINPDGKILELTEPGVIAALAGSEGKAGAAAELTLALLPLPEYIWGVAYFFTDFNAACGFVSALGAWNANSEIKLDCAEFFDSGALRLLDESREENALLKGLPDFPGKACAAVYVELSSNDGAALEHALSEQLELFSASGGKEEDTWAESGFSGIERFRNMRHALQELVGAKTGFSEKRTRLETDFSGPAKKIEDYLRLYCSGASSTGVSCAVYGHVLQNRLHAAFLYGSAEEFDAASALISDWAKFVRSDGGLPVSENGYGRLKRALK